MGPQVYKFSQNNLVLKMHENLLMYSNFTYYFLLFSLYMNFKEHIIILTEVVSTELPQSFF